MHCSKVGPTQNVNNLTLEEHQSYSKPTLKEILVYKLGNIRRNYKQISICFVR